MKTFFYFLVLSIMLLQSCKKDDSKTYLNGTAVIEGTTVYYDSQDEQEHAVTNILITVSIKNGETYKKLFETTSADGKFRFESLKGGTYELKTSFMTGGKLYSRSEVFELTTGEYKSLKLILTTPGTQATFTISGTVRFDNPLTGTNVPAGGSIINLLNAQGEEVATTTSASNGSFEFTGIEPGNYTIRGELSTSPDTEGGTVDYQGILSATITSADLSSQVIHLDWIANTTLLCIHVTDSIQNPLANASVCIYSNQIFMTANGYSCNGSERSASTNAQGNVVFSNLSTVRYYIAAKKSVGSVELYSDSLEATPAPLSGNTLTTRNIQLRQEW